MNIFTKIDRFFHPSKYKDDRITKPLALVKEKDYVFVLVLMRNPFDFKLDGENLYYISNALYGATLVKVDGDYKAAFRLSKEAIEKYACMREHN